MPSDGLSKVGDLARQTGVTVRTLHHYERLGLLIPSQRSSAGHRLYSAADVERLHRIRSLQQLGFSLDEIRRCLERPEFTLRRVIDMHMARLDEELTMHKQLRDRLGALACALDSAQTISVEKLVRTMELMDRIEKHYTVEQLEKLQKRREEVGTERIRQVQEEWGELIALVRAQMQRGADPESPEVQTLSRRWMGLVHEFTAGDPGIASSLANVYQSEPELHESLPNVPDPEMMKFMARARAADEEA